jgi:hypothetical protein
MCLLILSRPVNSRFRFVGRFERGPAGDDRPHFETPSPLLEEAQDGLRTRIGNGERLHAELLLNLQRLQSGRFLSKVGVDQVAQTFGQDVDERSGKVGLNLDPLRDGTEGSKLIRDRSDRGVDCRKRGRSASTGGKIR